MSRICLLALGDSTVSLGLDFLYLFGPLLGSCGGFAGVHGRLVMTGCVSFAELLLSK